MISKEWYMNNNYRYLSELSKRLGGKLIGDVVRIGDREIRVEKTENGYIPRIFDTTKRCAYINILLRDVNDIDLDQVIDITYNNIIERSLLTRQLRERKDFKYSDIKIF
ncbi:hypothetical protein [Clostridium sp.]|uniref:hypothetical protein n=1 Tax=Clostridium sp. TaxID=1506 RepID=UPI003991BC98